MNPEEIPLATFFIVTLLSLALINTKTTIFRQLTLPMCATTLLITSLHVASLTGFELKSFKQDATNIDDIRIWMFFLAVYAVSKLHYLVIYATEDKAPATSTTQAEPASNRSDSTPSSGVKIMVTHTKDGNSYGFIDGREIMLGSEKNHPIGTLSYTRQE